MGRKTKLFWAFQTFFWELEQVDLGSFQEVMKLKLWEV